MADLTPYLPSPPPGDDDELVAIPRLAERTGVTPRVLRYWEELGLISPTRERGKLRYSPRDTALARLTKRLIDSGVSLDALQMLKELSEREVRRAARDGDREALTELALRILYQRKAFREVTGMDDEHYPEGHPPPPAHGPAADGPGRHGPPPKGRGPKHKPPPAKW
jgi:MerR family transcriptional regulator, heat shock protein HspR